MLRLIEGGLSSVAYENIKEEIKKLTNLGKRVFLLVPEQQAVIAERDIMDTLPPSASLTFEVTNFTRLANTVYRNLGGLAGEYSTKAKEALIMWKTLSELSPFLKMTSGSEINTGMVEKALAAVSELKSISATPDELSAIAENECIKKDRRLSSKLADITKIMSLYTKLLEEKYTSASDECARLGAKLKENTEFLSNAYFFISGFTSFTEPQYTVIGELIKRCTVNVHLALSKRNYEAFEFSEIIKTKSRLISIADKASAEKRIERYDTPIQAKNPLLVEACDLLWRSFARADANSVIENRDALRIFEAKDPYDECDFIAADIKRRVMAGASFSDFAIIARDAKKYDGILDASLDNAGIPSYISKKTEIASFEAIKLIYSAFAVVENNFAREDVISYAKCKLSGASNEACDEFELYTETWQITGNRFTDGIFWNMSPLGIGGAKTKETDALLIRIDEARRKIIDPLVKFSENLKEAKTVRDHAEALIRFANDISLEDAIYEQSRKLYAMGETDTAEKNERIWGIICDSLDDMTEALSNSEIDAGGFLSQLKVVFAEVDIGSIPAYTDVVTIGSANMLRLNGKKHVYLMGVNAGEFPASPGGNAYFTQRDKETLSSLGLNTDPDADVPYARELFFFSRAFAVANESVTILYSVRNEALGAYAAAEVIASITKMTDGVIKPTKTTLLDFSEKIYFPSVALEFAGREDIRRALSDSGYGKEIAMSEASIKNSSLSLSKETTDKIYKDDIALTQTRIESYVDCPFAYYLKYNIKLSEGERAEFDARNIGTFIHSILESFFSSLSDEGKNAGEVTKEERAERVKAAAKSYLDSIESETGTSKRQSLLLDRLYRASLPVVDGLCDELAGCEFTPRFFELKLDGDNDALPNPATFTDENGRRAFVYGSVDRVDTYKRGDDVYVRVIDYKTGKKSFSPADLDEGKNLQMFLYLKAIVDTDNEKFKNEAGVTNDGRLIPAGVIYVKTDMGDVTIPRNDKDAEAFEIAKKQERRGMILNDPAAIEAMNKDYLPIKFSKVTGAPTKSSEENLYTLEGWDEISEKISGKIGEISGRMKNGDISLASKGGGAHCDTCRFKPICRKNS